ncbi:MAG: SDR family oxidoreductase [Chloroflexi bacterium]|nr:SDR family oxidoreductase [Chloroflexota bacterium]
MGQRLSGKVAVVTGGGSGIGRCTALDLAAEGARVVVNDLGLWTADKPAGEKSADVVAAEINKSGGKAVASGDSVSTVAGCERVIKTAVDNFGRVDILVLCAGTVKNHLIEEITAEDWQKIMDVHVNGHFGCIKYAVPLMKKQGGGRIVAISSRQAFNAGSSPVYSVAKAAILGLTRSLAIQLGKHGITINAVMPSAGTPLFPGIGLKEKKATPDTVSSLLVYLSTDEARGINGQLFFINGGNLELYSQQRPVRTLHKEGKWTVDELVRLVPRTFSPDMDLASQLLLVGGKVG